ncbi:hypothetical protein C8R46DRAFT_1088590 [Mycena filopes]|nr:hypothetical protein C8R46DRAFT_1088590 [Mycena filopes]
MDPIESPELVAAAEVLGKNVTCGGCGGLVGVVVVVVNTVRVGGATTVLVVGVGIGTTGGSSTPWTTVNCFPAAS